IVFLLCRNDGVADPPLALLLLGLGHGHGHGRGRQLLPGLRPHLGGRACQDPEQWPTAHSLPRSHLRLRLPVQEGVPLRQDRHAAQARAGELRWHRHRLLLVLSGADARRDRLRVPRQPHRRALHPPHQRVHAGDGEQGNAVQALVRSHQGLPLLLCSLEPQTCHLHGRRHTDQGLQEPGIEGHPFPKNQPMRIYSSLWNADDWATRGGLVKTDWNNAPFTASYRNFNADACIWSSGISSCAPRNSGSAAPAAAAARAWWNQEMDTPSRDRMRWVQKNYMIYHYCTDLKRFPQGLPQSAP
ncbi:unnamed protein product, partial [Musa textilis]